jgi:battenin
MESSQYEPAPHENIIDTIGLQTLAFFAVGILNNASYVIMLASAKSISEGGVAAVYISCVLPSLLIKLTAPYWFDRINYKARMAAATVFMAIAFVVTAWFTRTNFNNENASLRLAGELMGVALISCQCGIGEASLLALAGKTDGITLNAKALTAFSSGTGLAGIMGYMWKIGWMEFFQFSTSQMLWMAAIVLPLSYGFMNARLIRATFSIANREPNRITRQQEEQELVPYHEGGETESSGTVSDDSSPIRSPCALWDETPLTELDRSQRFRLVLNCWKYTIPLFLVYAAEYACQSGAWTAIGFPVSDRQSRDRFYEQSNWLYQAGVFVSRSSGTLFTVNMLGLWIMPIPQVVNLIGFSVTAFAGGIFYNRPLLLSESFYTGLLGGGVYVHGYKRIVSDVSPAKVEICLASVSVADSIGILVADVSGLFLQSCLYRHHGIPGALVGCPI